MNTNYIDVNNKHKYVSTNIQPSTSGKIQTCPGGWSDLGWNIMHHEDDRPHEGRDPPPGEFEYFN